MQTTIDGTPIVPSRLAVPPPARPWPHHETTDRTIQRRLYRRHAATLAAMAAVALLVLLVDGLLTPRGPEGLPLWLVLAAGVGAVAVGASVRRMEARVQPASRHDAAAGTRPPAHLSGARTRATTALASEPIASHRWRRTLLRVLFPERGAPPSACDGRP